MSFGSSYDDMLEDKECPVCHHVGMDSDGSFGFMCPNCDYEGSFEEDYEEESDDDSDDE